MVAYTIVILAAWFGMIFFPLWITASAQPELEDIRDRQHRNENSKTTHFLRG